MSDVTARSILMLCDDDPGHAGNVLDHLEAFRRHSQHEISFFNPRRGDSDESLDLDEFDVVVIHYTIVVTVDAYLPARLAKKVAAYSGLKIQFIQDEYRWVDEITAKIRELGIDLLYSLVPEDAVPRIYGERLPRTDIVTTLAGYVPEGLADRQVPSLHARRVDVGYRGRHVPYWLGRLGQEKVEIGRRFKRAPEARGLTLDIAWSESDRIYGDAWFGFLADCRTTLGTESSASIVDFTGEVERTVTRYMTTHPAAGFDEIEDAVLAPYEGNVVINVISPRVFEAAALGTGLVLFPGDYSGAIEPWRHYIPLEKDFSNIGEVVDAVRNDKRLSSLIANAFEDLVVSGRWSLARFVEEFDREVAARAPAPKQRVKRAFEEAMRIQASANGVLSPRSRLRARAKQAAAQYAVARSPESRRLRASYQRSNRARATVPLERFTEDLEKLAVLIGVQQHRLSVVDPFVVVPVLREDGLILTSRPFTEANVAEARRRAAEAIERLRQGLVREIVWHHAAVGTAVWIRVAAGRPIPVHVGYHGMYGVHHFSALERLERVVRGAVVSALRAAMMPPTTLPAGRRLRLRRSYVRHGSSVIGMTLPLLSRDARGYVARGVAALRFGMATPRIRRLLELYARHAKIRRRVHPLELLDDILKLSLLERIAQSERGMRLAVTVDPTSSTVVVKSVEASAAPNGAAAISSAQRLIWDHSRFGNVIELDSGVATTLDEDGTHEFRAFAALCGALGEDLAPLLEGIIDQGERG